jgi:hypothetical protein
MTNPPDPRDKAVLVRLTEAELALIRRNGLNPARCMIAAALYFEQVQQRIARGNASREDQGWMRDVGQTLSHRREKIARARVSEKPVSRPKVLPLRK